MLKELVSDYSHLRVVRYRCCRSYSHNFLVTNISKTIDVTIVHYTSSCDIFTERKSMAVRKFKSETFKLRDKLANDLLDFDTGVYLISHPDVGENNDIQKRIYERLGEREYDIGKFKFDKDDAIFENDIAVLELDSTFTFEPKCNEIPYSTRKDTDTNTCRISGWRGVNINDELF
ncbi:unnamed protein product [Mytilus coruscus]|uniref:Uncharacterized protein n=1 Tax=Mytilus coruscus TaxID=42192 RepID=A0A6J8ERK9_MYTCO|nr:unnamed protein product [Mytilus coruscus]